MAGEWRKRMSIELPLEKMSVAEKLQVMEMVWASLCHKPADVASPEWHATVLRQIKGVRNHRSRERTKVSGTFNSSIPQRKL
jgi:hypothetical protein